MAANLAKFGYRLIVHDNDQQRAKEYVTNYELITRWRATDTSRGEKLVLTRLRSHNTMDITLLRQFL